MGRVFVRHPWRHWSLSGKSREGRLPKSCVTVHRVPDGYLEIFWWNPGCIEPTVPASHSGSRDSELAEACCDPRCLRRHPVERIEAQDFTDSPTLRRKLRPIEQRGCANARSPCQRGHPELVDTDADGRYDAEPCYYRLSLHRLALSPVALGRVSSRNPGIYVSR